MVPLVTVAAGLEWPERKKKAFTLTEVFAKNISLPRTALRRVLLPGLEEDKGRTR